MPLLNYTTQIAAGKTAGEGHPVALAFQVGTPFGPQQFALPVNANAVFEVLVQDKVSPKFKTREQANRVAWRILKDWVEAQLAIVATQMVTLDQVMLPYLRTDDGSTIYDRFVTQRLAITGGDQ